MSHVVVLGAGALGSVYGAWFADAGHDVTLVARPAHAEAIAARGLTVRDRFGGARTIALTATADAGAAGDADIVCLATKAQDTAAVLSAYRGRAAMAFSIQNGARQAEPVVERFGAAAVGCSSMVGATLDEPGIVTHSFEGATYLGDLASSARGTAKGIAAALPAPSEVRDDIASVLWSKAVLAAAAMGVSSLTRLPYHQVFRQQGSREVFLQIASETAAIARAEGALLIDLPGPLQIGTLTTLGRDDALELLRGIGANLEATGQTAVRVSMLQSVERNRPLEHDAVFAAVVELADRHGLSVPTLRAAAKLVAAIDGYIREGGGA